MYGIQLTPTIPCFLASVFIMPITTEEMIDPRTYGNFQAVVSISGFIG